MNFYVLGFIVCFVHDGLFAHLPLQLPLPQSILWWFNVMMMWTYRMKEHVLMQQASFEPKCSINDFFFFFFTVCKGEHVCRSRMVYFLEVPFLLSYWLSVVVLLSCFLHFYQLGPNEASYNDDRDVFSFKRLTCGTTSTIPETNSNEIHPGQSQ